MRLLGKVDRRRVVVGYFMATTVLLIGVVGACKKNNSGPQVSSGGDVPNPPKASNPFPKTVYNDLTKASISTALPNKGIIAADGSKEPLKKSKVMLADVVKDKFEYNVVTGAGLSSFFKKNEVKDITTIDKILQKGPFIVGFSDYSTYIFVVGLDKSHKQLIYVDPKAQIETFYSVPISELYQSTYINYPDKQKKPVDKASLIAGSDGSLMTPCYTHMKIYKQKSTNSCLITCIAMLVRSLKNDASALVNDTWAEYKLDGSKNPKVNFFPDEGQLANDNGLKHGYLPYWGTQDIFKGDMMNVKTGEKDSKGDDLYKTLVLSDKYLDDNMKVALDILKKGPFVIGLIPEGHEVGHALLVVGVNEKSKKIIYIDPEDDPISKKNHEKSFTDFLSTCQDIYYPNTYIP